MSVVIAIKEKDRIVMGCDKQISSYNLKFNTLKDNAKIWDVNNLKGAIMGGVGDARMCQLISLMDFVLPPENIINKQINYKTVASYMFNIIYNHLIANKNIELDDKNNYIQRINGSLIFAYKNQAYLIDSYGYTIPIEDYLVIGSGTEIAIGVLEQTKDLEPEQRIKKAINACANKTLYVNNDIEIKTTKQRRNKWQEENRN